MGRKSNQSFSRSSLVVAIGSCQCHCIGTHSPAALLLKMPVQLREKFAAGLCVSGKWGSWKEMAGLPPAFVLLQSSKTAVLSTLAIQCSIASEITSLPWIASPLIVSTSQCTCCYSNRLVASLGEYPLILIASGIFTLVSGFASQATKKRAVFLERQSTWYSLLFEDMVKCLFPTEKGK